MVEKGGSREKSQGAQSLFTQAQREIEASEWNGSPFVALPFLVIFSLPSLLL